MIAAIFVACAWNVHAQPSGLALAERTNGCGTTGISGVIVPNATFLSQCTFKTACDRHDRCYGRCLSGGDLAGQATCNDAPARKARRRVCDIALQTDIRFDNANRPICGMYGAIYQWAVEKFGDEAFRGFSVQTAEMRDVRDFLGYIDQHPAAFDLPEVEKAFASASDGKYSGVVVRFTGKATQSPRLLISGHDGTGYVTLFDARARVAP